MDKGLFSFVVFVNGKIFKAVSHQYITDNSHLQSMKFGVYCGAAMFKKTASVYVYRQNDTDTDWILCDSMNSKPTDCAPLKYDNKTLLSLDI